MSADTTSSLERILRRVPMRSRIVAETVATCALSEFRHRWPDHATAMAAVVCGRWIRNARAPSGDWLDPPDARYVDRVVNECYCALDNDQVAAANRLFEELYKGG